MASSTQRAMGDMNATHIDHNGEYMLESDEGSPLPIIDHFTENLNAYDNLHFFDGPHQPKDVFSTSPAMPNIAKAIGSPPSPDSISDSSSSKRTGSTLSTKSTFTGGDVMMSDGYEAKQEVNWNEFVNDDEETGQDMGLNAMGGTIDPTTLDTFFANASSNPHRHAISASNTPSPFDTTAHSLASEASLSPNPANCFSPTAHQGPKSYYNGPSVSPGPSEDMAAAFNRMRQYSGTHSKSGSRRGHFRGNSQWQTKSENASPSALFNSPSPQAGLTQDGVANPGQNGTQLWAPHASNAFSMPQQMPGGVMGFPGMPVPMPGLSAFNFAQASWGQGPPYTLKIGGDTSKSRVETQIRIKINLSALPPGVRKLHLPRHTISKPKLLIKPAPPRCPDMLELHTALYCTSALQDDALKEKALQRTRAAAMSGQLDPLPEVAEGEDNVNQGQHGAEVHICKGCITRERKRASRKKLKKPEDDKLWLQDEGRRIVVFNSQEIRDWSGPNDDGGGFSVDCQMRIACYCRHHAEKQGFNVIFTITDYQGNLIGQAMSAPIMITDDHKTHGSNTATANSPGDNPQLLQPPTLGQDVKKSSHSPTGVPIRLAPNPATSELQPAKSHPPPYPYQGQPPSAHSSSSVQVSNPNPRLLSRPASPTSISGPSSKKRKASGLVKIPSGLSMTRIDTGHVTNTPPQPQQGSAASIPSATSPSPFSMPAFSSGMEPLFAPDGNGSIAQPFATGPITPNGTGNEQILFANGSSSRATSYDTAVMSNHHMYSAPASTLPSRAPSPGGFRNSTNTNNNNNAISAQQQNPQFAQALVSELYNTMPMSMSAPPQPPSVIHKIIPAEGPKSGGIEVTILGSGFHRGLEVMFGDIRATTTTFWGESSLVCLLPPSPVSGTVLVSLKHLDPSAAPQVSGKGTTFKYTDDDEQQLMRTALTVLGHKMNGKIEDIADIARRIIGNMDSPWNPSSGSSAHGQRGAGGAGQFNNYASGAEIESHLLKVLDLIDLDDSPHKPRLNLRRATGQTMLHLACSLGLHRFVAGLLARGANPDMHDKGGYTPLHMASLNNHPEIVKRLMLGGADPSLRTLSGLTAADVARSSEVVWAIRRVERHERSRSVGSLRSRSHSRASSMTSLRSLWDPQTAMTQVSPEFAVQADGEFETGEESPEYSGEESPDYSSENFVSEDDSDANNELWMSPRRSSVASSRRDSMHGRAVEPRNGRARVGAGLHSPAAAVTALKDQMTTQMHNFQQAMALHLQNMPQFPYLPQMPAMTPLADYQAFLNGAAVFQRFASFVPNARPGSAGGQSPTQASDGKWWNMASLAAPLMGAPTPPPAYEEIYPQSDLDTKQASAVGAAAEAEADEKCAALFDQGQTSASNVEALLSTDESSDEAASEDMPEPNQQHKAPELLQIGRKNAITKEQQENLQRARAAKLKTLSRDSGLFFIWLPLLFIVVGAWLYSLFPTLPSATTDFLTSGTIGNIVAGVAPLG